MGCGEVNALKSVSVGLLSLSAKEKNFSVSFLSYIQYQEKQLYHLSMQNAKHLTFKFIPRCQLFHNLQLGNSYHRFAVVVRRGASQLGCKRLRCKRLQHRTCKTSRGHFASHGLGAHGFSTERARLAGGTLLCSFFQSSCYLLGF